MLSNGNHNSPGFFSLPPTFWSLFTATVGVKMLSSPHWALTKRKPLELYNTVKLPEQRRKEHYLLKLIIFDHCPFLLKHGRGLEKRKGRGEKQTNRACSCVCVYVCVHAHTYTKYWYSPQMSIRFPVQPWAKQNLYVALQEKPQFPSSQTSLSQGNGTKFLFLAKASFRSDSKLGDSFPSQRC